MTDDLIALARLHVLPVGTHYDGCEADHPFCLLHRMAEEIERLRDTSRTTGRAYAQIDEAGP